MCGEEDIGSRGMNVWRGRCRDGLRERENGDRPSWLSRVEILNEENRGSASDRPSESERGFEIRVEFYFGISCSHLATCVFRMVLGRRGLRFSHLDGKQLGSQAYPLNITLA
eukprot:1364085-Amorphochlora_amoeboformis.AAC.1